MIQDNSPVESHVSASTVLLAFAATLLGLTIQITRGLYSPIGVAMLAVVVGLLAIATFARFRATPFKNARGFLVLLFMVQLFTMILTPAGEALFFSPGTPPAAWIALMILAGAAVICIAGAKRLAVSGFVLLLGIQAGIGIWRIRTNPDPAIDVYIVQSEAISALSRGENPYAITYPNIYEPQYDIYPPGALKAGRVQYGYPYPPLALLLTAPGQLLFGDVRYIYLIAMLAAATLIALTRRDQIGMLFGALFLFLPPGIYVLQMSWIEPVVALLLVATLCCAVRRPNLLWLPLGLLVASKQYLFPVLLLVPLLEVQNKRVLVVRALMVAAVVSLPLALWNLPAFLHSAVQFHLHTPYRPDSLSFPAWWGFGRAGWAPPSWMAFVAMGIAVLASLKWAPRSPAGLAMAIAFCFLIFFSLSKQAFANYYDLILAACCAAACLKDCIPTAVAADRKLSDHAQAAHLHLLPDNGLAGAGAAG